MPLVVITTPACKPSISCGIIAVITIQSMVVNDEVLFLHRLELDSSKKGDELIPSVLQINTNPNIIKAGRNNREEGLLRYS